MASTAEVIAVLGGLAGGFSQGRQARRAFELEEELQRNRLAESEQRMLDQVIRRAALAGGPSAVRQILQQRPELLGGFGMTVKPTFDEAKRNAIGFALAGAIPETATAEERALADAFGSLPRAEMGRALLGFPTSTRRTSLDPFDALFFGDPKGTFLEGLDPAQKFGALSVLKGFGASPQGPFLAGMADISFLGIPGVSRIEDLFTRQSAGGGGRGAASATTQGSGYSRADLEQDVSTVGNLALDTGTRARALARIRRLGPNVASSEELDRLEEHIRQVLDLEEQAHGGPD